MYSSGRVGRCDLDTDLKPRRLCAKAQLSGPHAQMARLRRGAKGAHLVELIVHLRARVPPLPLPICSLALHHVPLGEAPGAGTLPAAPITVPRTHTQNCGVRQGPSLLTQERGAVRCGEQGNGLGVM
jgi:hypothetical protein